MVGQRYIDQMTLGGITSIKRAAQSIYNTGEKDPEVLDVAAEVLLQRYGSAVNNDIDTLSWVAKALGKSGNSRYHATLKEVVESDSNRKLRKYASKALDQVGKPDDNQYQKGMVDLLEIRNSRQSTASNATADQAGNASGIHGLDIIREGMTMEEVYSLVGHPTSTSSHQTGKAWIPFNFGAKDLARSISAYKGKGRVIFSHDGYSSAVRVVEVILDPNETGYP